MKRHAMSRSSSRSNFTRHAVKTHKFNTNTRVMRGGFRL